MQNHTNSKTNDLIYTKKREIWNIYEPQQHTTTTAHQVPLFVPWFWLLLSSYHSRSFNSWFNMYNVYPMSDWNPLYNMIFCLRHIFFIFFIHTHKIKQYCHHQTKHSLIVWNHDCLITDMVDKHRTSHLKFKDIENPLRLIIGLH